MIWSLVVSLFLTITIECILAWILGIRNRKALELVVLVNVVTNPAVVFLSQTCRILSSVQVYWIIYCVLEMGAFLVEGKYYSKYLEPIDEKGAQWKGYGLSLMLNSASLSIGLLLSKLM